MTAADRYAIAHADTKPKTPKASKGWRSGFCGLRAEAWQHERCKGTSPQGTVCICTCHQSPVGEAPTPTVEGTPPALAPRSPGHLRELPDLIQGSEDWHDQRRGMVTASVVGQLVSVNTPDPLTLDCPKCEAVAGTSCVSTARKVPTPIKAVHSERTAAASTLPPVYTTATTDTAQGLTALLATERVTGWTEDTPMTSDMWRGVEAEPFAREKYAEHYAPVTEVGFMVREADDWRLGYSPDGLVGDDGLIEIKAPRAKTHFRTILADEVPSHYMAQCQAGLLVSGRKWLDFVSFVGGMPLYRKRVEPDPQWFDAITAACIAFEANAAQIVADYEARVDGLPMTERIDFNTVELKLA